MSRNGYTRSVRKSEYALIERLADRLPALERELHEKDTESAPTLEPFIDEAKERRRARIEQKRRHKPKRPAEGGTDQP